MAGTAEPQDMQVEHIGAPPHPTRNRIIGVGAALLLGSMVLFYYMAGRSGKEAASELDRFRQTMFAQCKLESFSGSTDPMLSKIYARNSRMQAVVREQLAVLDRGQADCDAIVKALRRVDYPVP